MRIALVNQNHAGSLESKRAYLPLGLAYMAAFLREKTKHELKVIDAAALDLSNEEVEKILKEFGADVVGVGAVTDTFEGALNVCKIAKRLGMKTVVGGVHATVLPEESIAFDEIDIVVIGEGEYTLAELLNVMEKKEDLKKVRGIIFKKKVKDKIKLVKTELRGRIQNLDELPFPARDLFPWKLYSSYSSLVRNVPCMHIMTSRGCPFHCTFCASQKLWKGSISRTPKNIVAEIEHLIKNYKVKEIYLFDDTFNLDLKRIEEFCAEIIKRKIKLSFRVVARVYPITKEILQKMKKVGVWCIQYGIESGNQEVIKDIKKGIDLKQARKTFKMTNDVGIRTFGFFMIGLPKDTKKTIQETLNFALELNPDFVNFAILTIYPGTDIYELAIKEKSIERIKPKEIFKPQLYKHPILSQKELDDELSKIYKKFYMRPNYLLKRLIRIKTFTELKTNIIAGLPFLKPKGDPFKVSKKWIPLEK